MDSQVSNVKESIHMYSHEDRMWLFADRKLIMQGYKYEIFIISKLWSSLHFKKSLRKLKD